MRKWVLLVVLASLYAAGPFLSSRGLGTAEAYNYSLSVADAVTQFRAGTFPVLAGQSEFAFNGRVHPLRTAPYMCYLAGGLDLLTFRQLSFWTLQNLTLALSLIAGALVCYGALRRVTPATPATAAVLSAVYILSPGVLAAAYGMDLYMTVMTVPFVPLIIAANVASLDGRRREVAIPLAASLAACWLAHPPVALWLSVITLLLQALAAGRHPPGRREWPVLAGAALLFVALTGFAFASVFSISPYGKVTQSHSVSGLLAEVGRNFTASLRPVSAHANQLGDFQLGYAGWGLALGALGLAAWRRHIPALGLLFAAMLLFTLTAPVPGLNAWLWEHAPGPVFNLTSQWPMQRLYLPMAALVVFAFALVWTTRPVALPSLLRDGFRLLLVLGAVWMLWQSWRFVGRGYATREAQASAPRSHLTGGIDLTVISYAPLAAPQSFVHGVMDPAFEFRLLAPYDAAEIATNWSAPLPPSPENFSGELQPAPGEDGVTPELSPAFTLQPGARYRLTFHFLVPPGTATLQLRGSPFLREYQLPSAGNSRGFGMQPGNNPALTLEGSTAAPETVRLRLVGAPADDAWRDRTFARFDFERIEPAALPVALESLIPLRARVRTPAAGYLETPRVFIDGYAATVDGRPVRVQPSPEGLLMLPVPAGESRVQVSYPGPPLVRLTFWLSALGWAGLAAWGLLRAGPSRLSAWTAGRLARLSQTAGAALARIPRRGWLAAAGLLLLLAALAPVWHAWTQYRSAVGPVRIRFVLPRGETNRQQPLLVTGQPQAGVFIYAVYTDADHIRLGFDVWGKAGALTAPLRVDYFAEHELVVECGALYPADHPTLRDLSAEKLARLRRRLRLELDGRTVLERELEVFESRRQDVTVGRNRIGGSTCEPAFAGQILRTDRLPVPRPAD